MTKESPEALMEKATPTQKVKPEKPAKDPFAFYDENMNNETVLDKEVDLVLRDPDLGDVMRVSFRDGIEGIITKDEADADVQWSSLVTFIGLKIPVMVIGVDRENSRVLCSRKKAQEQIKPKLVELLYRRDTPISATVSKMLAYGAYIDVSGVTGILKNSDFSVDHTAVQDVLKIGQRVDVLLSKVSEGSERMYFEAVKKYKNPNPVDTSRYNADDVVKGKVVAVKDFGMFVRVKPGFDVLCPPPREEEAVVGYTAVIKLTQIHNQKGELQGRGKFIRFIYG